MTSVRSTLVDFVPYSWETPSYEIAERYGLSLGEVVRMDLNTSPYHPRRWLNKLASYLADMPVNLYPDTSYKKFREAVSSYANKSIDEILVGNGADE
ncbi:MAG: histidinol-phosphate transaminase, partial [Nitrososphaerota archaeon]|nr:histidinol-phosphate transaminase [Nitrososphaerota archaeon]